MRTTEAKAPETTIGNPTVDFFALACDLGRTCRTTARGLSACVETRIETCTFPVSWSAVEVSGGRGTLAGLLHFTQLVQKRHHLPLQLAQESEFPLHLFVLIEAHCHACALWLEGPCCELLGCHRHPFQHPWWRITTEILRWCGTMRRGARQYRRLATGVGKRISNLSKQGSWCLPLGVAVIADNKPLGRLPALACVRRARPVI
mmetsp:Transcript_43642/g.115322  ORF Transcript_43642/g.115322 Transcript_43642/m.115322 type:complete len:204 (+) Transcript_43642:114-725(+)